MRLTFDFEISPTTIPKNYNRGFISLIKYLIQSKSELLYHYYYDKKRLKPFTFSVYFPQLNGMDSDKINAGNIAYLNFSSSDLFLLSSIYNSFREIKEHRWQQNGNEIYFKPIKVKLNPHKKINKDIATFKTLSPVLINNIGDSHKFLLPGEDGFIEGLEFAVRQCAKEFLNYEEKFPLEFEIGKWGREVVYVYQKMPSVNGIFVIKSLPEILQMIYDIGLGVHRSQGFGMLEVIK
ncbi:CRISPR-associated endoribonuclease Cas6 [Rosettibacter firmus]|uniref:CRISPR-associated endoribonuclease Cas6 n=1 Tax=Rosettibacter firmus TaxID=3111522 RepID=UPI00336BEF49